MLEVKPARVDRSDYISQYWIFHIALTRKYFSDVLYGYFFVAVSFL